MTSRWFQIFAQQFHRLHRAVYRNGRYLRWRVPPSEGVPRNAQENGTTQRPTSIDVKMRDHVGVMSPWRALEKTNITSAQAVVSITGRTREEDDRHQNDHYSTRRVDLYAFLLRLARNPAAECTDLRTCRMRRRWHARTIPNSSNGHQTGVFKDAKTLQGTKRTANIRS